MKSKNVRDQEKEEKGGSKGEGNSKDDYPQLPRSLKDQSRTGKGAGKHQEKDKDEQIEREGKREKDDKDGNGGVSKRVLTLLTSFYKRDAHGNIIEDENNAKLINWGTIGAWICAFFVVVGFGVAMTVVIHKRKKSMSQARKPALGSEASHSLAPPPPSSSSSVPSSSPSPNTAVPVPASRTAAPVAAAMKGAKGTTSGAVKPSPVPAKMQTGGVRHSGGAAAATPLVVVEAEKEEKGSKSKGVHEGEKRKSTAVRQREKDEQEQSLLSLEESFFGSSTPATQGWKGSAGRGAEMEDSEDEPDSHGDGGLNSMDLEEYLSSDFAGDFQDEMDEQEDAESV